MTSTGGEVRQRFRYTVPHLRVTANRGTVTQSRSLDFAQPAGGAFPRGEARLNIAGFTRTGVATRSPPVDLSLLGRLDPAGGSPDAAAV